jgi:colicin import membrane protein
VSAPRLPGRAVEPAVPPRAGPPTRPPRSGGTLRAIGLALATHALLIGLLVFGLKWTHREPEPVQAELWVPPPTKALPAPQVPRPTPQPEPAPPKVEPPPAPRPEPAPPPKAEPDIKVEQARREAERKETERRLADQRAAEKKEAQRKEAERKADDKRADEKRAEDKRLAERRAAEQKAMEQKAAAQKASEQKAADDRRRAEQARKDAAAADQRRTEDIRRLQSQAGTTGVPSDQATRGAATGRIDAGYGARVAAAIRANTVFRLPVDLDGNPKAVFQVQLRPDCSVAAVRLRRSSGVPAWDQAAERGIQATDPFPRPADGRCQGEFEIASGPRDER